MALADLARPLPRVSESTRIDELIRDLRRDRQHVALVVDEHGRAMPDPGEVVLSGRS